MSLVKHKTALKEIFEAEMQAGGLLESKCDGVLLTAFDNLPDTYSKFITLADFIIDDVIVGRKTSKFVAILQTIVCASVISDNNVGSNAEFQCMDLGLAVRTILKNNPTLTSVSYPSGVAKETFVLSSPVEPLIYSDVRCMAMSITVEIRMEA